MGSMDQTIAVRPLNGAAKRLRSFKWWWNRYGIGYSFLAPFLIFLFVFTVLPVLIAMGMSLTYDNLLQPSTFVGLQNFKKLLMDDDVFLLSLKNTFLFAGIVGPIGFIASFLFAWILNGIKHNNLFALAFYAPSLTSSIAMSQVWLWFFAGDKYGLINHTLLNMGIITEPILWNKDGNFILPTVIIISIWMSMGTGFLVFMAGLKSVPRSLYEAASIDGMRYKWEELWYITLPVMKPQLLFAAINSITTSFAVFETATAVAGMPSPNYAAHTIVAHLYDHAFLRFEMGYASAVAVVLFLITFAFGRIAMRIFKSDD